MRRLLIVLTVITALIVGLDLVRPQWLDGVRGAGATVVAPWQSAVAGAAGAPRSDVAQERDELAAQVARLEAQLAQTDAAQEISDAGWAQHDLLPARVVSAASGVRPVTQRQLSIDVGEDDGVRPDMAVVNADGLVGRIIRARARSSDVLLLGDVDVVVGVRFAGEALGSVSADQAPGLPEREPGELTLTALGESDIEVGDQVRTLGSVDNIPYVADIPVGRVSAVDPDAGQLGSTAVVEPAAQVDALDHVAVVMVEQP